MCIWALLSADWSIGHEISPVNMSLIFFQRSFLFQRRAYFEIHLTSPHSKVENLVGFQCGKHGYCTTKLQRNTKKETSEDGCIPTGYPDLRVQLRSCYILQQAYTTVIFKINTIPSSSPLSLWDYNLITSFLPGNPFMHPSLFSFKFIASFFSVIECIYVHACIPKYHLSNPYEATCVYLVGSNPLEMDNQWVYSSLRRAPQFH